MESLAFVVLIALTAALYSSVGHAGASGYLAVMALAGIGPEVMRPSALALNILVAAIATVQFARAGHFSWGTFWPFAAASVPLAFVGGSLTLPTLVYKRILGVVLVYAAVRLAWRLPAAEVFRDPPRAAAMGLGAAIGLLSGLTGVGGGIFLSPVLLLAGWADARRTAGVSAAFILVNSIAGLAGYWPATGALPVAIWSWAAAAVVGGVIGSHLGSRRIPTLALRRLLALVLAFAGAKMIGGI